MPFPWKFFCKNRALKVPNMANPVFTEETARYTGTVYEIFLLSLRN
jgi:hypothetical protein